MLTIDIHQQAADSLHSVWLSAHAGSGKTKALVDRVLRLLLEGTTPASILCITYTRAAATEMQGRIQAALSAWVRMPDDELDAVLQRLLARPPQEAERQRARILLCVLLDDADGIRIQTIHSFCQSLLTRFPIEAGISPGFKLAEDRQRHELLEETRQLLFTRALSDQQSPDLVVALERLATMTSDHGYSELTQALVSQHALLYSLLARPGGREDMIRAVFRGLDCPPDSTTAIILAEFTAGEPPIREALSRAAEILSHSSVTDKKQAECISRWLASMQDEAAFEDYCGAYITSEGGARKNLCTAGISIKYPDISDLLAAQQYRVIDTAARLNAVRTALFSAAAINLADAFLSLYRKEKNRRGLLDYDDLILHTLTLLSQPGMCEWVISRLGRDIGHLLVDEAQDTSPPQWALTQILVTELFVPDLYKDSPRTLFVVGDAKQSIYSFQGADAREFAEMRDYYRDYFLQTGQHFRELALTKSFRSTKAVLRLVDAVCALPDMASGIAERDVEHQVHRNGEAGRVELWPLVEVDEVEIPAPWEVEAPLDAGDGGYVKLAAQISETIHLWLEEGRPLPAKGRPVQPGDIMILLRKRTNMLRPLITELRRAGIAVAGVDRLRLVNHPAVKDVLALADFCLLPSDDLTLACVLKGPWFGWNEEQLFDLAYDRGEVSLWSVIQSTDVIPAKAGIQPMVSLDSRLRGNDDYSKLLSIRERALADAPYEWLAFMLETLGGRRALKAQFGEEADECCDELLLQAMQFESVHTPCLQHFVHWVRTGESDVKREMETGRDAVRILTVHGAKGLQAPIVILPDTTQLPRTDKTLWWSSVEGQAVCYVVPSGHGKPPQVEEICEDMKLRERREYYRQFYVALTRAEDECYITGLKTGKKLPDGCWYQLAERAFEAMGGKLLESPQEKTLKEFAANEAMTERLPLPEWLKMASLRGEVADTAIHFSATTQPEGGLLRSARNDDSASRRGTLIHALLQWLPVPPAEVTQDMLMQLAASLSDETVDKVDAAREVLAIYTHPELQWLFGASSLAEVPVAGQLLGGPIYRQIDRLIIEEQDIHIIDYKTDRTVPARIDGIPPGYVSQLATYRSLIQKAYPRHRVHTALLWTAEQRLQVVTHSVSTSPAPIA